MEPASDEEQPGGAEHPDGELRDRGEAILIAHSSEPTLAGTGNGLVRAQALMPGYAL